MQYEWDGYILDLGTRRLMFEDDEVRIEPRVFELLAYLIEHRSRVVPKNDILDELWESRFVSEYALTTCVKHARRAVGDTGRAQQTIRTAHGAGYQFVADVQIVGDGQGNPPDQGGEIPTTPGDTFLGRADDLAALGAAHEQASIVSVVGPAGVGKTRLCVEWAAGLPAEEAVVMLPLAEVLDDAPVSHALALALAIQPGEEAELTDALGAYLRGAPHTLILDNCEHQLDQVRTLIARLLEAAPRTRFVLTTREQLGWPDELLLHLTPLPVEPGPDGDSPAVMLFRDRARRVSREFGLDPADVDRLHELCAALDGLPLVIELAASRMAMFDVPELMARLDQRLDLLVGTGGAPADSRGALRETLLWSYELLGPDERRLFRHLAAFPGGTGLDGLEWLAAELGLRDPWAPLTKLVDASLVVRASTDVGSWFSLLETMRSFALDQLESEDERTAALDQLGAWTLHLTSNMDKTIRSEREAEWNVRIRRELANIRAARQYFQSTDRFADSVALSTALDEWARPRNVSEIWEWSEEAVAWTDHLDPVDVGRVHALAAGAAWQRGRLDDARSLATEALASAELDPWIDARASTALAAVEMFSGNPVRALELWGHRVALDGYLPDAANIELVKAYMGEPIPALEALRMLAQQAADSGSPSAIAWTQYILGEVGALIGDPEHRWRLERAIELADDIGGSFIRGVAGVTLAGSLAASGETALAATTYTDLIAHWLRNSAWTQQWTTLRNVAELIADHDPGLALALLEAADRSPHGASISDERREASDALLAGLAATLDAEDRMKAASADHVELARMAIASLQELAASAAD